MAASDDGMSTSPDHLTLESYQKKQIRVRAYGGVATRQDYLPDPTEAIDRWFQSACSSNARTTARIISDLHSRHPAVVIDPFCGAGSSAIAARMLGARFIGVELDPVLACIAHCKLWSDESKCIAIQQCLKPGIRSRWASLSQAENSQLEKRFAILYRCRALSGRPITADEIQRDLSVHAAAISSSQVIAGNASQKSTWSRVSGVNNNWVIYASPPFGDLQVFDNWPWWLKRQARRAMHTRSIEETQSRGGEGNPPEQNAVHRLSSVIIRVLESVASQMGRGFAIIEHERGDPRMPSAKDVARQISTSAQVNVIEILETATFSVRGMLSLILCEITP